MDAPAPAPAAPVPPIIVPAEPPAQLSDGAMIVVFICLVLIAATVLKPKPNDNPGGK